MSKQSIEYENNPFNIGLTGIKLLFANARNVAIAAIVLCVVSAGTSAVSNIVDLSTTAITPERELAAQQRANEQSIREFFNSSPEELVVIGVLIATVLFIAVIVSLLIYGIIDYTAAKLAQGEQTELKDAFKEVGKNLASYLWLYLIITVKVFLWSLLLIVPGFIMAVRYSLAGTAFFAEGKRGNAAVKRSLELTQGAWFTTFAGMSLWNIMTLGQVPYLLQPGTNAVLYRQFKDNPKKPAAHWLSWATLLAPIALVIGLLAMTAVVVIVVTMLT